MPHDNALKAALERTSESAEVDFKSAFDVAKAGEWLEIIKDVAAFANSGGGIVLVGLNDDGTPAGSDVTPALSIDPADFANRIHKYTSTHFNGFEFLE